MISEKVVFGKRYILTYFVGDDGDDISECIEFRSVLEDQDIVLLLFDRLVRREDVQLALIHAEEGAFHYLLKRWIK